MPQDAIVARDKRFAELRRALPKHGTVGYVTDGPLDRPLGDGRVHSVLMIAQYCLAPVILVNSTEPEIIVGDFSEHGIGRAGDRGATPRRHPLVRKRRLSAAQGRQVTLISLILFVLPIPAGIVFVSLLWPDRRWQSDFALKASLAIGIGYGIISCVFFIWLLSSGNAHYSAYFAAECALVAISAAVLIVRARKRDDRPPWRPDAAPSRLPRTRLLILAALVLLMFSRIAAGLIEAVGQPSGDADAWSTWNLQARFLSRGGPNWVDLARYSYPHHTDYPLMLPLSVARGWQAAGVETAAAPIAIGIFFTFGTVLLLFSALSFLRNPVRGFVAGAVLLGTPFFILHGARQLADVPLGFFILAATVLFCLQDRLATREFRARGAGRRGVRPGGLDQE